MSNVQLSTRESPGRGAIKARGVPVPRSQCSVSDYLTASTGAAGHWLAFTANIFLGTPRFPAGALVVQNGTAADPADISDINGFAYGGSTQFRLVSTKAILEAVLGPMP